MHPGGGGDGVQHPEGGGDGIQYPGVEVLDCGSNRVHLQVEHNRVVLEPGKEGEGGEGEEGKEGGEVDSLIPLNVCIQTSHLNSLLFM